MPVDKDSILNGNGTAIAPKPELKRPNPPAKQQEQPSDTDTSLALQQAIGEEAALTQEVIQSAQAQGTSLAVKSNVAQFTAFASTNAKLLKQRRGAYRQLLQATEQATDAIEVEAAEDTNFFTSVCDSLTSVSFSLPGQSAPAALPSTNGSEKN